MGSAFRLRSREGVGQGAIPNVDQGDSSRVAHSLERERIAQKLHDLLEYGSMPCNPKRAQSEIIRGISVDI